MGRIRHLLFAVLAASSFSGSCRCGDGDGDAAPAVEASPSADDGGRADEPGPTSPVKASPVDVPMEEAIDGTLHVEIRDFQVFHPDSTSPSTRDPRDLSRVTKVQWGDGGGGEFAIGLVLEVKNNSVFSLERPRVISDLDISGLHGTVKCQAEAPRKAAPWQEQSITVLSSTGGEKGQWIDESRDPLEKLWRPQETIRIAAVLPCGPATIHDLELDRIGGTFTVAAAPQYSTLGDACQRATEVCEVDVIGTSPEIDLPASALTLRRVKLASGSTGYLAGDLLIRSDGGRLVREGLASQDLTALSVKASEVPEQPARAVQKIDEWTLSVTKVEMHHWADLPGTPKGERVVKVTADVSIDSKALDRRLRSEIDASKQADTAAREKLQRAQKAYEKALGGDVTAIQEAQAKMRDADSEARQAGASLSKSLTSYERTLRAERSRLGRLLACDRVELITHKRNVRAVNAADASTLCRTLDSVDSVHATWEFQVDRYEVPIGLSLMTGNEPRSLFFAARSLMGFDPR